MKPIYTFISIILIALLFSCSSTETKQDVERANEPWFFRSVVDGKARMLTLALHENLWLAYSTQSTSLYKAWRGDVNFEGAVYTGAHGPQPLSRGTTYLQEEIKSPWQVFKGDKALEVSSHYRGHRVKNKRITLLYDLEYEKGKYIRVEESPEYIEYADKSPGLERTFLSKDVPEGYSVKINLSIQNLSRKDRIFSNAEYELTELEPSADSLNPEVPTSPQYEAQLSLKPNDESTFTYYFNNELLQVEASEDLAGTGMESLFENSGCYSCHNPRQKAIGPAYTAVAEKYKMNPQNIEYLANKVLKGGVGNWGKVAMNPHPDLDPKDARNMVKYILSMNEENRQAQSDLAKITGMVYNVYQIWDRWEKVQELPKDVQAYHSFTHWGGYFQVKDALPVSNNFVVKAKGTLNISESRNQLFKADTRSGGIQVKIDGKLVIDDGQVKDGPSEKQGEITLEPGQYEIEFTYFCPELPEYSSISVPIFSVALFNPKSQNFETWFPAGFITYDEKDRIENTEEPIPTYTGPVIPGDGIPLQAVHPSFELSQARPDDFKPRVAGLDFLSDGRMVISTWDSLGAVYILDNLKAKDPNDIQYKKIAFGLAEPLGLKVVDDEIYVLQKQELTKLVDTDGDDIIDEYRTLCNDWIVSGNFHEFAFGLAYKEEHFYFSLAIAIEPGGKSTNPQMPDRGKVLKVHKDTGKREFLAHGLRTPNGIGLGVDNEIFVADNQGDWLPANKVVHVRKGAFYGSRAVDFKGTENLKMTPPVVWLAQDEIGNSPSQIAPLKVGPYKGQMIHGEVTHGGIKRVFAEKVKGQYQGAVFRFIQGLEAGVNRIAWSPEGDLYAGQIGVSGNWGHVTSEGMGMYGLQRLRYNKKASFEMLAIRAKQNGLEIEFTQALQVQDGANPKDYEIKQWWYKPTENYGGPKMDEEFLEVKSATVSSDRKKVFLEIEGMEEEHVVYVRLKNHFVSAENQGLWSTEAWYTLNKIPDEKGKVSDESFRPLADNQLSEAEKAAGWKLLFDGETIEHWRNYGQETIGSNWRVENGALTLDGPKNEEGNFVNGGDIITKEEYENFEFSIEWKISKAGNSGIIYNVVESDEYDYVWQTGPEMQVLDDARHPDARLLKHRAGDLYDMIESKYVSVNPAGEWNKARVRIKDGKVQHWLNGHKVVEFEMGNAAWKEMIANSKFKDMPGFGRAKKGHIALQDHHDRVQFKNIKIRTLK